MNIIRKKLARTILWLFIGLGLLILCLVCLFAILFFLGVWYKDAFME